MPHRHGQMAQLFIFMAGRVACLVDGISQDLSDRTFLYVPEHSVHEFNFEPEMSGLVISFPTHIVRSVEPAGGDIVSALARPFSEGLGDRVIGLVDQLQATYESQTPFRAQQAIGLAHCLLAQLAELAMTAGATSTTLQSRRMERLDAMIHQHMADSWTARDYANALSMSTGHLSRLCRAATGAGAAAYIERRVIAEACRLLAFTRLPISDVGYRVGYGDPSYFSKRFRAICSVTPSSYRAQFLG
ncbi:MAG: helix-turn-helix domain-containing protein [Rhodobacteraceae bacterium]|nr:helix-turn-helix domain-containing protein [Paracoccaceae bacterium]